MRLLVGEQRIRVVARLMERDGACCAWCGRSLVAESANARVDLVVLTIDGGDDDELNWVVACEPCELSRGPRDADWWLLSRTRYVRKPNVATIECRLREIVAAAEMDPTHRRVLAARQASRDLHRIGRRYGDLSSA